jgi:uncharacterized protein (DUF1330 family)
MKATIIVESVFHPGYELCFEEYATRVRRYLERHQGKVIRRQRIAQTLYGAEKPDLVMVIDFPERALAEKVFFEQDYLGIIPLRDRVSSRFNMYLADFEDVQPITPCCIRQVGRGAHHSTGDVMFLICRGNGMFLSQNNILGEASGRYVAH